jgi:hypothetical protein
VLVVRDYVSLESNQGEAPADVVSRESRDREMSEKV